MSWRLLESRTKLPLASYASAIWGISRRRSLASVHALETPLLTICQNSRTSIRTLQVAVNTPIILKSRIEELDQLGPISIGLLRHLIFWYKMRTEGNKEGRWDEANRHVTEARVACFLRISGRSTKFQLSGRLFEHLTNIPVMRKFRSTTEHLTKSQKSQQEMILLEW